MIPEHGSGLRGGEISAIAVSVLANRADACSAPRGAVRALAHAVEDSPCLNKILSRRGKPRRMGEVFVWLSRGIFETTYNNADHDFYQREVPWHALLNRPEARRARGA